MKRTMKSAALILALIMILSSVPFGVYATDDTVSNASDNETIELQMGEVRVEKQEDGGWIASFDLLQETTAPENPDEEVISPKAVYWSIVGVASLRMRLSPGHGIGYFDWRVDLTNGDKVKGVSATLVCEKNNFLNYTNYAKVYLDEWYNIGTLYSNVSGTETFKFPDVDYGQNVRFKWSSFTVTGVTQSYSARNGEQTGTVKDFAF